MHHGADSDGTDRCKLPSVLLPYIPGQIPVAGLEAGHDILHRVGPDIIYQAVLPLMAPLCNRGRRLIGQYSLDSGGTKLNPKRCPSFCDTKYNLFCAHIHHPSLNCHCHCSQRR